MMNIRKEIIIMGSCFLLMNAGFAGASQESILQEAKGVLERIDYANNHIYVRQDTRRLRLKVSNDVCRESQFLLGSQIRIFYQKKVDGTLHVFEIVGEDPGGR
jgi:hypothetical protein